ncbi:MAG: hypothetical protein PHP11_01610 [Erysipelotrichaceae bacterium]|nr:hypothetical protein [Erysipelotrichaceae bacterium]MDD3923782.1 hypothetical protein [Erysipelotrichaceae bacterium]MDD4642428.1 hypothetical protein [Erysipelotrichaceae bacterium]
MRGFSGIFIFIIVLVLLQAAWPLIVFFGIYMLVRYIVSVFMAKKEVEQQTQHQQVNEDWINRSYQQNNIDKDVIDVEYTERDADK